MKALFNSTSGKAVILNLIGPRSRIPWILKWLSERGLIFQRWVKD